MLSCESDSVPGSSVHGILQARMLEWAAISSSRGSSPPRDQTCISQVSWIGRWILYPLRHLGSLRSEEAVAKRQIFLILCITPFQHLSRTSVPHKIYNDLSKLFLLGKDTLEVCFFDCWVFVWLGGVLVAACGLQFPNQGSNPSPLHWQCGILNNGPPWKSQ